MDNEQLIEETERHVSVAAAQVARRFRGYVTYADLAQEGALWVLRHPGTVRGLLEDGRRGEGRLVGKLASHMAKIARQERAAYNGYEPDDEAFYSMGALDVLLPGIWDDEYLISGPSRTQEAWAEGPVTNTEPVGVPDHEGGLSGGSAPRPSRPYTDGMDFTVAVMDVRRAWERAVMDLNWRLALGYRYGDAMLIQQVADALGVHRETATAYIEKGKRALVRELGGHRPGVCPRDCECRNE